MSKYRNITIEELAKLICENHGKSVDFTAEDANNLHYSAPSGWHGARLIEFFDSTHPTLVLGYYGGYTMVVKSLRDYCYEETGEMPFGPLSPQVLIACVEDIVRSYIEDEYGDIPTVCTDWFKPKKNTDEELRMIMEDEARLNPKRRNHWAKVICNSILKEEFDDVELPPEDAYDLAMEIYDKYLDSSYSKLDMLKSDSLAKYVREVYLKEYKDVPVNLYDDAEDDADEDMGSCNCFLCSMMTQALWGDYIHQVFDKLPVGQK